MSASLLGGALAHLPRKQFRALYLDRRNILLRDEQVADGSVDHAPVYVVGERGFGLEDVTQTGPTG